jgi:hypothetical protein
MSGYSLSQRVLMLGSVVSISTIANDIGHASRRFKSILMATLPNE